MTPTSLPDDWLLPPDWTDSARDVFLGGIDERPDLAGAELASLEHAAALTSSADRLDGVARDAGIVATGSTGQVVLHPAVTEARLARASASTILARLVTPTAGPQTASQRGRAAARARYSR
ncbi:hypothetical protein B7R21_11645 [Subtercola boreus]|uniref:Uncharacterized protein n=1 Tax=Subtercola boreus TaxID=120213 RepID=A0A3E0VQZ5_9MICO|nr:hypothetical protein [Subtercola boreus]RFA11980.1 hypothetical protein B7R21_11645 [Subtercola boreus]